MWGVDGIDQSDVGLWDPEDLGTLIWNDNFTVSPKENQQALMDLCADLASVDNPIVKDQEVDCWITDLDSYIQEQTSDVKSLPLDDESQFDQYLKAFATQTEKGRAYVKS